MRTTNKEMERMVEEILNKIFDKWEKIEQPTGKIDLDKADSLIFDEIGEQKEDPFDGDFYVSIEERTIETEEEKYPSGEFYVKYGYGEYNDFVYGNIKTNKTIWEINQFRK